MGREYALPTGRFREARFHWPLSGGEFEEGPTQPDPKLPPAPRCQERPLSDALPPLGVFIYRNATSQLSRSFRHPPSRLIRP